MTKLNRLARKFRFINSVSLGLLIVCTIGFFSFLAGLLIPNPLLATIGLGVSAVSILTNNVVVAPLEQNILREIREETDHRLDEADGQ